MFLHTRLKASLGRYWKTSETKQDATLIEGGAGNGCER